MAVNYEDLKKN